MARLAACIPVLLAALAALAAGEAEIAQLNGTLQLIVDADKDVVIVPRAADGSLGAPISLRMRNDTELQQFCVDKVEAKAVELRAEAAVTRANVTALEAKIAQLETVLATKVDAVFVAMQLLGVARGADVTDLAGKVSTLRTEVTEMHTCASQTTLYDAASGVCNTAVRMEDVPECATANGGCAHICLEQYNAAPLCQCRTGFMLDTDMKSCFDINECVIAGKGCTADEFCTNTPGGRTCECLAGLQSKQGGGCEPCPAGEFKDKIGNTACTACPTDSTPDANMTGCLCDAGYFGSTSSGCTECPADSYKATAGNSAACTSCPAATHSPQKSTAAAACLPGEWKVVGKLEDMDAILTQYPRTHFEYGVAYNGDIQSAIITLWNLGLRVMLSPFYPQGDTFNSFAFGTAVFMRGLRPHAGSRVWYHRYYQINADGIGSTHGSNSVTGQVNVYIRPMLEPWMSVGPISQFQTHVTKYPPTDYEYGFVYNGHIQRAFINKWNRGTRISGSPMYFQGDDETSLNLGTTVFTQGLDGSADKTSIFHHYYRFPDKYTTSNGISNSVPMYIRKLSHKWIKAGGLKDLSATLNKYPPTMYELGVLYNGIGPQPALRSGWNRGTRLTLYPTYPQGDTSTSLSFGTAIFTKGLDDNSNKGSFFQHYYQFNDNNGVGERYASSNGNADTVGLYVRQRKYAWKEVGVLANLATLRTTYPGTTHELGMAYNGEIQVGFFSGWNKGQRFTLYPLFPQGDNSRTLIFGTALFSQNVNGISANTWTQGYYRFPNVYAGSNGPSGSLKVYARLHSYTIHSAAFGAA